MFPRKIKNFNAYLNGDSWAARVTEATLPELSLKTDEYRGAGMNGSIDIVMGQEKMEASLTFAEWNPAVFNAWGNVLPLVLRPAAQGEGDFDADPHIFTMNARWLKVEPDALKVADTSNLKITGNVHYFRAENAGVPTVEIDIENMIHIVNGVDQMASMRAAMGL